MIELVMEMNEKMNINARVRDFVIPTAQPEKLGGTNSAPTPVEYFLASLGTCAALYVKLFCDKRHIPTDEIEVSLQAEQDPKAVVTDVKILIRVPSSFPQDHLHALKSAAEFCPVKKSIQGHPVFDVTTEIV
jgi:ribosomal protein S12 methylthiotransferase accessory factor